MLRLGGLPNHKNLQQISKNIHLLSLQNLVILHEIITLLTNPNSRK